MAPDRRPADDPVGAQQREDLYNWKSQPGKAKLTRDLLERASYILGIYKSLEILLPDEGLADQWLATPNDNPLFNGTARWIGCWPDRWSIWPWSGISLMRSGWLVIDFDTLPVSETNEPVYRVILARYPQIPVRARLQSTGLGRALCRGSL